MRGTANDEAVVSQANSKAFEDGYDRIFGKDRKPERGSFVFDPEQQKFVPAGEYRPPERALDAPIMAGRFYENTVSTEGEDLGSRRRHAEYMRRHGVAMLSDYTHHLEKKREERVRFLNEGNNTDADRKQRREDVGRTIYELQQRKGRDHG